MRVDEQCSTCRSHQKATTMDILIVDDDSISVMMLQHALAPLGHRVTVARSGEEAIERFRQRRCRLVISDWLMPGIDGVTLCRLIRQLTLSTSVYFMLLTSWPRDLDVVEGLSAGADDILIKPFDPAELRVRIRNAERILNLEELAAAQQALAESEARLLEYTRSLETANRDLERTKALLEKKNDRLNMLYRMAQKFVDNVSHEFRTPVTVVKEYASLIAEGVVGPVTPEQHRFLNIIAERADDLNIIVDDMLDGSRLDAGMLSVVRQQRPISQIIDHVRPILERKAAARNVSLEFDIGPSLPDVFADVEKVGRIMINLVVNAIKFCGDPGKVIVSAASDLSVPEVAVSVSDNGPGIDPQRQAEVFDRFKQLGGREDVDSKGFGLGLSIVKELVGLNLGQLQLHSRPRIGTTFQFTLPAADPLEILRRYVDQFDNNDQRRATLTLFEASIPENTEAELANEIEQVLGRLLQHNDLLLPLPDSCRLASAESGFAEARPTAAERKGTSSWAILSPVLDADVEKMMARLTNALDEMNRNRPGGKLPAVRYEVRGCWPPDRTLEYVSSFLRQRGC